MSAPGDRDMSAPGDRDTSDPGDDESSGNGPGVDGAAVDLSRIVETEGRIVKGRADQKNADRYRAIGSVPDWESLRERARRHKEESIERLPSLVETVTAAVEDNGGTVYLAEDAVDAASYVADLTDEIDAEVAVKSKSMTTEEIELNDHLEDRGVEVWETDLGEFVVQLADEDPSHLVGPAMHKSRAEIAALFEASFDLDEPLETPEALTRFARDFLGERILEADIGITGANFVLAESGSIVLVTNEGNARKCAITPDVLVSVAGVEKLLPSVTSLHPFVELLARSATGQSISRYLSVFTPPLDVPTVDFEADEWGDPSDREFHLVLLDNGRYDLRADDDLRETLYCIRCGACSNSCANFQHAGGHAFGGETYSGGIATGWEAGVNGLASTETFNDLCTGCTRCVDACPVKIDVPWINTVVRDRRNRSVDGTMFDPLVEGLRPDEDPASVPLEKRFFGNVETLARVASKTAPLSNWIAGSSPVRYALDRVVGIDRRRPLPTFVRTTFVDWFESRGGVAASKRRAMAHRSRRSGCPESIELEPIASGSVERERDSVAADVVVYPDLYTNHVEPGRGVATVRSLEAIGLVVCVPRAGESGRAPLSQGMIESARENATSVYETLAPHFEAARPVVVVEPSDRAAFVREYERLLPTDRARRLAAATLGPMELVAAAAMENDSVENSAVNEESPPEERSNESSTDLDRTGLRRGNGQRVRYHPHCQGRTLGSHRRVIEVLERLGYDVVTTDVECCGMAGSFGYKRAYYDLSVAVGDSLVTAIEEHDSEIVVADGTSCRDQLSHCGQITAHHPIELIAPPKADRPNERR